MDLMRRPVRIVLVVLGTAGLVTLAIGAAVSIWLSSWIPTKGKAWLEAKLEQQGPLDVEIGSLRYSPWEGLLCEDVTLTDRRARTLWAHAPLIRTHVGLMALATNRIADFRIKANLDVPAQTLLTVDGRYGLRDRRGFVEISTDALPLGTLAPVLKDRMKGLQSGTARFTLRATWRPGAAPEVSGRLTATDVLWRMEGMPEIEAIEELSGAFRLAGDVLIIERLEGRTRGASWELDGTLGPLAAPVIDVRGRTQVDLAALPHWLPQAAAWRPEGKIRTILIARGPLNQWPQIELMADTEMAGASLSVPGFPHRLERITGRVQYDHLTREARITSLAGEVLEHQVSAQGAILVADPLLLDLAVKADGDVAALQTLLPKNHAVQSAKGHATIDLALSGPATQPAWKGQAAVMGLTITLRGMADAVEGLEGMIAFTHEEVRTSDLRLRLRDIPLRVDASLTDMTSQPRLSGIATFPQGSLKLDARLRPETVDLTQADLTIERSNVRLTGRVGRVNAPSELQAHGVMELADLARLPILNLTALEPWALQGAVMLQGKLRGVLTEWQELDMLGSGGAQQVFVRGVPMRNVSVQWQQHAGVLMMKLVQAEVSGGRLSGTWFAELHSDPVKLVADADVTTLDLSQLAASVPAWNTRDIRGTASAHVELSGFPRDQASWRGTGWVNMSGGHLGELPLLDRVFHGVFGALAERLGLADLRRAKLTKVAGQWRLSQGRIMTDNLQLSGSAGAEPIIIMIRGSVGLDKTLDLTVEPNLPEQLVLEAPNTSSLSRTILRVVGGAERMRQAVGRHHVGGTIEKPEYKFEFNLEQLLNQVLPAGFGQLLEGVR